MANIVFSLHSKQERSNIEARLTYTENGQRKSQYARIKFEVSKDFWNEYRQGINFRDVSKANLKTEMEEHFHKIKSFVLRKFDNEEEIKPNWLKDALHEYYHPPKVTAVPESLLAYFDYYLDLRKSEIIPLTKSYLKWNEIKNKVARFQKATGKQYKIRDVNETFKKEWANWCDHQKYAPQTTKKNLSYIKTICLHAQTKGIQVSPELAPLSIRLKEKAVPKVYLSFQELEQIKALNDLPEYLDNARDWLLISCYTGQRISDFMRFNSSMIRKSKGKHFLDLTQQKTGKDVTVPLIPEVLEILDKRNGDFPRRISDQRYNDYIKEVCERAGINNEMYGKKAMVTKMKGKEVKRAVPGVYPKFELIGSHVGRRSFATNYYGKIPTSYLKNITGHSTEAMLLRYIGKTSNDTAFEAYDLMIKR